MNEDEMKHEADKEITKRSEFKVEEVFTQEQLNQLNEFSGNDQSKFNDVFNSAFENYDNVLQNNDTYDQMFNTNEIQPYNWGNGQELMSYGSLSNTISNLSEAFGPIKINKQTTQPMTYEQMIEQREEQNKTFKCAKQSKNNN